MKNPSALTRKEQTNAVRGIVASVAGPVLTAPPELGASPCHILVADDDASVRDVSASLLARAGYHVTAAPDGEAAWVALCADKYDVLITDHAMPSLTGLELLRRVRSGPLSLLPCVLMSGKMPWKAPDLLDLVRPGMALAKPFSFFELLTCVRGLLPAFGRNSAGLEPHHTLQANDNTHLRPEIAWQDDARTRLPLRPLVR